MDSMICQVNLSDLEKLCKIKGVGDLTVLVKKPKYLDKIVSEVKTKLPEGCSVGNMERNFS